MSRIVEPARAPIPILICFLTLSSSPSPENRTTRQNRTQHVPIAASGTAPKKGSTILPISPAQRGISSSSSLPSEIKFAPLNRMKLYTPNRKRSCIYITPSPFSYHTKPSLRNTLNIDEQLRQNHSHPEKWSFHGAKWSFLIPEVGTISCVAAG